MSRSWLAKFPSREADYHDSENEVSLEKNNKSEPVSITCKTPNACAREAGTEVLQVIIVIVIIVIVILIVIIVIVIIVIVRMIVIVVIVIIVIVIVVIVVIIVIIVIVVVVVVVVVVVGGPGVTGRLSCSEVRRSKQHPHR